MGLFTLKTATVEVRGQKLTVRELTAGARAEMLEAVKAGQLGRAQIVIAQHCVIKDDGAPMFGAGKTEEVNDWPPDVVEAVQNKVMELSGLRDENASPKG